MQLPHPSQQHPPDMVCSCPTTPSSTHLTWRAVTPLFSAVLYCPCEGPSKAGSVVVAQRRHCVPDAGVVAGEAHNHLVQGRVDHLTMAGDRSG